MRQKILAAMATLAAIFGFVVLVLAPRGISAQGPMGHPPEGAPKFQVDPFWVKPLPDRWVTGDVSGTCVDAQDHLFITNRGNLYPKEKNTATPAPPVIEFDANGQMVNSWGDWAVLPKTLHGCFVDYEGNVWIGGNEDAIVQKYSHDGSKLLLQIGTKGVFDTSDGAITGAPMNSSYTLLNCPPSVAVDPANGDVYIADGYGNRRVIVFDRNGLFSASGAGKAQRPRSLPEWAACSSKWCIA